MRIDIFPTSDGDGSEMTTAIRAEIEAAIPDADFRVVTSAQPFALVGSVMRADAVVLDLTPGEHHRYMTMSYPWLQDHVLAVSRTYLPVNVAPRRPGGAAIYPGSMRIGEIAGWVRGQLTGPGAIHRRGTGKRLMGALMGAAGNPQNSSSPWEDTDIFISYRSTDLAAAQRLVTELAAGRHHGGQPMKAALLEPGQLADPQEVLPPLLRWNALAVISDIVIACSEVWVVASRDYLASWWTQGELVCRLYAQGRALLRVYSPTARKVAETPASFQAALSEAQEKRLARLFANSHPSLMAPESMEAMRLLRPTRLPMPNDDVFSESFWNVPLLQCVQCSLAGGVPDHLDVGSFLRNSSPRLYPVPPDELAECAGTGRDLLCPNGCGTRYTVRSLAPRYLWYPLPVGPHKAYLESVPAFQAIPAGVSRR